MEPMIGSINSNYLFYDVSRLPWPLDYYITGVHELYQISKSESKTIAPWINDVSYKLIRLSDISTAATDRPQILKEIIDLLKAQKRGNLPPLNTKTQTAINEVISEKHRRYILPASEILVTFLDSPQKLENEQDFNFIHLFFAILFGDIGRALFLAKNAGSYDSFINEVRSEFNPNAVNLEKLLNFYYMCSLCGDFMIHLNPVQLCGTAGEGEGGADFQCSVGGKNIYYEAQRKESKLTNGQRADEYAGIMQALDKNGNRAPKVAPGKLKDCIFCFDVTPFAFNPKTIGVLPGLMEKTVSGFIYHAYADEQFGRDIQANHDWISAAIESYRALKSMNYGIAGVMITRKQFMLIDSSRGIGQAEGIFMVLGREYRGHIPSGLVSGVYLV